MQRKFKHKRTGNIATSVTTGEYLISNNNIFEFFIKAEYVEGSLDWEEMKEFEILSFTDLYSKDGILIEHSNSKFGIVYGEYTLQDQILKLIKGKKIHSIKRVSDGEVFTIGDSVVFNKKHEFFIERFYMDCYGDHLLCGNNSGTGHVNITKIDKVKIPFFVTEDGVQVNEGDAVYWTVKYVGHNYYTYQYKLTISKSHLTGSLSGTNSYKIFSTEKAAKDFCLKSRSLFTTEDGVEIFEGVIIYGIDVNWKIFLHYRDLEHKIKHWGKLPIFSTKEKAEEYILLNKPCLSIMDIIKKSYGEDSNKWGGIGMPMVSLNSMKELAKSKL